LGATTGRYSKQRGYALSVFVAFLSVSASVFTGQASASPVPHYTGNLIIAISGAIGLALVLLGSGVNVLVDRQGAKECVAFGLYNAVFQLGFFKSMGHLDVTGYNGVALGLGPLISALYAYAYLNETLSAFQFAAHARNLLVVVLVLNPFLLFSQREPQKGADVRLGLSWGLLACFGTAGMRVVQRRAAAIPSTVLALWGHIVCAVVWLLPGLIHRFRFPVFLPPTPQDDFVFRDVPLLAWISMLASGACGALVITLQGIILVQYLDVSTYSVVVASGLIVLAVAVDSIVLGSPLQVYQMAGVSLALVGGLTDYLGARKPDK
jgi:drug/metabolite transporter (DMT)-like permease